MEGNSRSLHHAEENNPFATASGWTKIEQPQTIEQSNVTAIQLPMASTGQFR
jgi:hypothetical protein